MSSWLLTEKQHGKYKETTRYKPSNLITSVKNPINWFMIVQYNYKKKINLYFIHS